MAELATDTQIIQARPTGTTPVVAYTAALVTEITTLLICNSTTADATFSLYHDDEGTGATEDTVLYHTVTVAGGRTTVISGQYPGTGISLTPGGTISVQSSVALALTFTAYGKPTSTVGNQNG